MFFYSKNNRLIFTIHQKTGGEEGRKGPRDRKKFTNRYLFEQYEGVRR